LLTTAVGHKYQTFLYQFQSAYITCIIFGGITFVGFSLGFAFWLDFRRRLSKSWRIAGLIVLFAGSLIGFIFGYQATQPEYFKKLTANNDGIHLAYHLVTRDVLTDWLLKPGRKQVIAVSWSIAVTRNNYCRQYHD
jgi:hypothetical protein